ncbi:MAG: oligosaccharide flippase family protein [Pseudomonadota bacterium]
MMMRSRTFRDVITTSFWALVNALSSRLLNLLTMLLAARALTAGEYGSLALMLNSAQAWSLLIGAGFSLTLSRFVASYRESQASRTPGLVVTLLLTALLLTVLVACSLMTFAEPLSRQFFAGSLLSDDVVVVGMWTFLLALVTVVQGALSGFEAFRQNALIGLGCGLLVLLLVFAGPATNQRWVLGSLLAGNVLTLLLSGVLLLLRVKTLYQPGNRLVDAAHLGPVLRFGLPALLGGVIVTQSQWHANVEVASTLGGLQKMAGLSVALQWYAIVQFVPGVIANSMLPMLARTERDPGTARRIFRLGLGVNLVAAIVMATAAISGRHLILALYGDHYPAFAEAFMVLALAASIAGSVSMLMQKIASHGKAVTLLLITLVWCATFFATLAGTGGENPLPVDVAVAYLVANAVQATVAIAWFFWRKGGG